MLRPCGLLAQRLALTSGRAMQGTKPASAGAASPKRLMSDQPTKQARAGNSRIWFALPLGACASWGGRTICSASSPFWDLLAAGWRGGEKEGGGYWV